MSNTRFKKAFSSLLAVMFGLTVTFAAYQGIVIVFSKKSSQDQTAAVYIPGQEIISKSVDTVKNTFNTDTTMNVSMGGDVMFDRHIRKLGNKQGFSNLLSGTALVFKNSDVSVVNLEGPITSTSSKTLLPDGSTTNKLQFTFPPQSVSALSDAGIKYVSLANNHTDNMGASGFSETKRWLDTSQIKYFGDPWNYGKSEAEFCKYNICIALVGYHAFQRGFPTILSDISRLKAKGDFVIVMPHWGEEYSTQSSDIIREQARQMIDAGASAIVGSHPHVIMDHEWINGVPVFYSLGNLLFDQYFSPEVMKGNIITLQIVKNEEGVKVKDVLIYDTSIASRKGTEIVGGPTKLEVGE